jgi:hypothetical protein
MADYYRWIKNTSGDLPTALVRNQLRSTYQKSGEVVESKSALWIFQLENYTPNSGIMADRTLVKITVNAEGAAILESPENHLDFEEEEFEGEGKHPAKIIVKANEPGARGLGNVILGFVNARITKIQVASAKELKKATG